MKVLYRTHVDFDNHSFICFDLQTIFLEDNTPTFVARYRAGQTGNMSPSEVFNASKVIIELAQVQKKSQALLYKLQKETLFSYCLIKYSFTDEFPRYPWKSSY